MRKSELEEKLYEAVAEALGVNPPLPDRRQPVRRRDHKVPRSPRIITLAAREYREHRTTEHA